MEMEVWAKGAKNCHFLGTLWSSRPPSPSPHAYQVGPSPSLTAISKDWPSWPREEMKCGPASREFAQSSGSHSQQPAVTLLVCSGHHAFDKTLPSRSYNPHPRDPTFQFRVVTQRGRCAPKPNEASKLLQQPTHRSKDSQFGPRGQWAHSTWLSAEAALHT